MRLTTYYATSSLSYSPPTTHTSFSHQPNGSSRRCLEAQNQICPGKSVVCTTTSTIMTQLPFPFLSSLPLHLIRTQQTMFSTLRLQVSNPVIKINDIHTFAGNLYSRRRISGTVPPARRFTCLSLKSNNAAPPELQSFVSTQFTSSVGLSPSSLQLSQWNLTHRNINVLNVISLVTAISATWLFCSAIPTLLAFKRAAESLEKLLDVTREELPGTMAAVRLSGMEISDLTMELSDLGQEITQGVRNSTRAVRMAEERLRGLTNMTSPAMVQGLANPKIGAAEPLLARSARGLREGIVKGRSLLQLFFTLTRFSKMALNYFATRAKS